MLEGKTLVFLMQGDVIVDGDNPEGGHDGFDPYTILIDDHDAACKAVDEVLSEETRRLKKWNWTSNCRIDENNRVIVAICSTLVPGLAKRIKDRAGQLMQQAHQVRRKV